MVTSRLLFSFFLFSFFLPLSTQAQESMDLVLDGVWEFRDPDSTGEWLSAKGVPGNIFTDLLHHEIIPDPYFRLNEQEVQWVSKRNWEYRTRFVLTEKQVNQFEHFDLIFEGLDTYATIYLNGQRLGESRNMFVPYKKWVTGLVQAGDNNLLVRFEPAEKRGLEAKNLDSYNLPASNDQGKYKVSPYVRKAPYQFGWDWAPHLVGCGIWRPVRLIGYSNARIESVNVTTLGFEENNARVRIDMDVWVENAGTYALRLGFEGPYLALGRDKQLKAGRSTVSYETTIANPRKWWPNEIGEPFLYDAVASISQRGKFLARHPFRFGLRTVELVQEPSGEGTSFLFRINGRETFIKGVNYVPLDAFPSRVDREKLEKTLNTAVTSHMNMLRVWGGGVYESDLFYDLCDKKGLLIWQDFMFGCSMYPADDPSFRANVHDEVTANVKRLRKHPCIALWCGNNEMKVAWFNWGWQTEYNLSPEDSTTIWNSYQLLFKKLIPDWVADDDPDRPYVSSSPISNWGPKGDFNTGDMHYWGVWHGDDLFDGYDANVGRFMSEYGFQSFPGAKSIAEFTHIQDHSLESEVMAAHQRSYKGNGLIRDFAEAYYPPVRNFYDFVYVSQLLQADGMKQAIEAHRRNRPHCMGTLYWQLNDCWPAASWSTIDSYDRWKAAQYAVEKAYRPVIISVEESKKQLGVYVISDLDTAMKGKLDILAMNMDGTIGKKSQQEIEVPANKSLEINKYLKKEAAQKKQQQNGCLFLHLDVGGETVADQVYFFVPPKKLNLLDPKLDAKTFPTPVGYLVQLTSKAVAIGVELRSNIGGHFSDNFFNILPGEVKEVIFFPDDPYVPPQVTVRSLYDLTRR